MPATIHPTAIVSPDARIGDDVEIGPYAIVEGKVEIGSGSVLGPHAVIRRYSRLGSGNFVDAGAVVGGLPQHLAFDGSETWVRIGDNNVMREGFTVNRAFEPGSETTIGSNCFFMAHSHVGHDCRIGDNVIMTNGVDIGGHVTVGRNVVLGAHAAAHQFLNIGAFAMVAASVPLRKDVLPFMTVGGEPIRHVRLNTVGLRRNGIDGDRYRALESALRALRKGQRDLQGIADTDEVRELREAMSRASKYGCYGFTKPSRS
jgi:UDP-N-acetylglucosamine acyltransferase